MGDLVDIRIARQTVMVRCGEITDFSVWCTFGPRLSREPPQQPPFLAAGLCTLTKSPLVTVQAQHISPCFGRVFRDGTRVRVPCQAQALVFLQQNSRVAVPIILHGCRQKGKPQDYLMKCFGDRRLGTPDWGLSYRLKGSHTVSTWDTGQGRGESNSVRCSASL